jgi:hypothetical protein
VQREPVGVHAGRVEEVVGQPRQPVRLALDAVEHLVHLLGGDGVAPGPQERGDALEHRQGEAEVVRDRRDEARPERLEVAQPAVRPLLRGDEPGRREREGGGLRERGRGVGLEAGDAMARTRPDDEHVRARLAGCADGDGEPRRVDVVGVEPRRRRLHPVGERGVLALGEVLLEHVDELLGGPARHRLEPLAVVDVDDRRAGVEALDDLAAQDPEDLGGLDAAEELARAVGDPAEERPLLLEVARHRPGEERDDEEERDAVRRGPRGERDRVGQDLLDDEGRRDDRPGPEGPAQVEPQRALDRQHGEDSPRRGDRVEGVEGDEGEPREHVAGEERRTRALERPGGADGAQRDLDEDADDDEHRDDAEAEGAGGRGGGLERGDRRLVEQHPRAGEDDRHPPDGGDDALAALQGGEGVHIGRLRRGRALATWPSGRQDGAMPTTPPRPDLAADLADISLPTAAGGEQRLGDLWADGPAILVHLRHFG